MNFALTPFVGSTTMWMKKRGEITNQIKTPEITCKTQIRKIYGAAHKSNIRLRFMGEEEKPHSRSVQ